MAERIVQEESLTTVADAIRAKGGTTDPLSFPTGFADAIAAIQAGGGDGSTVTGYTVLQGEITPSEDISSELVLLQASDLPDGVTLKGNVDCMFAIFGTHGNIGTGYIVAAFAPPNRQGSPTGSSSNISVGAVITDINTVAKNRMVMNSKFEADLILDCSSSYKLKAGILYRWLLLVPK